MDYGQAIEYLQRMYALRPEACGADGENALWIIEEKVADLRTALEALLDWLGPLHDQGEQVGNLDMTLVDQARAALAGAGE